MKRTLIDLQPPHSWNHEYGLAIEKLYHDHFYGLWELFTKGATGMATEEPAPLTMKALAEITNGIVALPQDIAADELPEISNGTVLKCEMKYMKGRLATSRDTVELLLRGMLSSLLEDPKLEDTGELAVCVCDALARAGWIPNPKQAKALESFSLKNITLSQANGDIMVEILLTAHKTTRLDLPIPHSKEVGIDLDGIATIMENRK